MALMSSSNVAVFNNFFWYAFSQEGGYNVDCALNGRPDHRNDAAHQLLTELHMAGFMRGHVYAEDPQAGPDTQTYYLAVPKRGGQAHDPLSEFQRSIDPAQRHFSHFLVLADPSVCDRLLNGQLIQAISFRPARDNDCLEIYDPFAMQPYATPSSEI